MDITKIARSLGYLPGTSNAVLIFTAIDKQKSEIVRSLMSHDKSSINCIDGSSGLTPLGYCTQNKYHELCTILLHCGADINTRDENGWTALHHAAHHGYENMCIMFIQHGAKINCRTKHNKYSPLHLAVLQKHLNVIHCLIKHKARAKIKDSAGRSLLHMAIDSGLAEDDWVLLLNQDIDVNVKNKLGQSPFMYAVMLNNIVAIRELFKGGADINMKDLKGKTPLYVATEEGHLEAMDLLINSGAISQSYSNKNSMQSAYPTSLHMAIFKGYDEEWLSCLLKVESEFEELNCKKQTPLMLAVQLNNTIATQSLLKAGVKTFDTYDETIVIRYLDIAANYNNKILLANVEGLLQSDKSYDILTSAIKNKKEFLVKYLVRNGKIIEDKHLEESIHEKNLNIFKFLLKENLQLKKPIIFILAKLFVEFLYTDCSKKNAAWIMKLGLDFTHIKDDLDFSLLWTAVLNLGLNTVELFLKPKYDPNIINERHGGKSLLQISIMNRNTEMVKLLLNKGAKPSIEIDELLSAILSKKVKIVKMLLDSNAEILNHHVNIAYYVGCDNIARVLIQRAGNRFPEDKSSSLDCDASICLMCRDNSSLKQFIKKLEELGTPPKKLFADKINDEYTMILIANTRYPRNYNVVAVFSFANYANVKKHQKELQNMSEKQQYISFTNEKVSLRKWTNILKRLPPVEYGSESRLLAKVESLIKRGDDLNACIFGGWNPLHIAVRQRYHRVAQLLINNGAKADFPNCNNDDSLTIAKRQQYKEMLKFLPVSDKHCHKTSERTKNIKNFKRYLEKYKNFDQAIADTKYPKNLELKKEMLEVIDKYLSMVYPGSNIALYCYGNFENLEIQLKTDPNLVNSQNSITGEGILHKAVDLEYYKFIHIFELLENFGIDLDLICFQKKETALYKAIRTDRIEIAQLLIVAKADCTLGSHILSVSSLELAKRKNLQILVDLMVNAGAKSNGQKVQSLFNLSRISFRNSIPQKYFRKCIESLDIRKFTRNNFMTWNVEHIQEKLLFGQFCNGPVLELIKICTATIIFNLPCLESINKIFRLRDWLQSYNDKIYACIIKDSIHKIIQILENRCNKDIYGIYKEKITEELKNVLNYILMKCDWNYLWNINPYSYSLLEFLLRIDPNLANKKHDITGESMLHIIILINSDYFKQCFEILKIHGCNLDVMCRKEQETPLYKAIRTDRIEVAETLIRAKANCSLGSRKLNKSSLELAKEKKLDELVNLMENAESSHD